MSPIAASVSPGAGDVREHILATAREYFFAQGFRNVTMDDLAAALGMSKKTLYVQFRNKRALLEAIILHKFRAVESDLTAIAGQHEIGFARALQKVLVCLHRHLDEVKPPFIRDVQRECPDLFRVVEVRRREIIERHLGTLLARGCQEGVVRKDVPLPLVMEILLAAVQAIRIRPGCGTGPGARAGHECDPGRDSRTRTDAKGG